MPYKLGNADFEAEFAEQMRKHPKPSYREWPFVLGLTALVGIAFFGIWHSDKIAALLFPH